jgi:hypothetical protein
MAIPTQPMKLGTRAISAAIARLRCFTSSPSASSRTSIQVLVVAERNVRHSFWQRLLLGRADSPPRSPRRPRACKQTDDLPGGVVEHPESVRLPAYPMPEDLCRSVALVPPHDLDHQVVVLGRCRSRWRLPKRVPLKQWTHDRVIAMQEQQVGECASRGWWLGPCCSISLQLVKPQQLVLDSGKSGIRRGEAGPQRGRHAVPTREPCRWPPRRSTRCARSPTAGTSAGRSPQRWAGSRGYAWARGH